MGEASGEVMALPRPGQRSCVLQGLGGRCDGIVLPRHRALRRFYISQCRGCAQSESRRESEPTSCGDEVHSGRVASSGAAVASHAAKASVGAGQAAIFCGATLRLQRNLRGVALDGCRSRRNRAAQAVIGLGRDHARTCAKCRKMAQTWPSGGLGVGGSRSLNRLLGRLCYEVHGDRSANQIH